MKKTKQVLEIAGNGKEPTLEWITEESPRVYRDEEGSMVIPLFSTSRIIAIPRGESIRGHGGTLVSHIPYGEDYPEFNAVSARQDYVDEETEIFLRNQERDIYLVTYHFLPHVVSFCYPETASHNETNSHF
ncbi:MAG: hypothetical protein KKG75_02065 [Nanoarchaeota archaeon]|nr:hypothetical protein [Nanoarchaeota archaeon]